MEITKCTAEDLMRRLYEFEQEFGMSSLAFYRLYKVDDAPAAIPPFERFVWADTCRRYARSVAPDSSPPRALALAS